MVDIAKSNSHSSLSSPLSRILHLPFNSKVAEPNGRKGGSSQNEEEGGREENIFCSSSSSDLLACMISRQASFPPSPSPLFRQNSYHHSRHFCYNLSRMY